MIWSGQQVEAIDAVGRWLGRSDEPIFRLFGYAGAGKTTLAKHLAQSAGTVYFAAYTGKAASVMRQKGCLMAQTIHQLIYLPSSKSKLLLRQLQGQLVDLIDQITAEKGDPEKSREVRKLRELIREEETRTKQPHFTLNPDSPIQGADLVVIDEVSMVDSKMADDLLSFNVPILALGDPAQLPPVKGEGFFTRARPDVMLTEIHRQARGNPVIDLATKVRQGEDLREGEYGNSLVMRGKPEESLVREADQILVGLNRTRRRCNHRMRTLMGRGADPLPVKGDRLVCLRNDHEVGLLNGTIWEVDHAEVVHDLNRMLLTVHSEEITLTVDAHTQYFTGHEDELNYWDIREAQCFDFGYALTTHKAQGSQWPNVFIFDESWQFRQDSRRWLYTAITRASEKVTICRN